MTLLMMIVIDEGEFVRQFGCRFLQLYQACPADAWRQSDVLIDQDGIPVGVNDQEAYRFARTFIRWNDNLNTLLLQTALKHPDIGEVFNHVDPGIG